MNSRFAVAIHLLAVLEVYKEEHKTSKFLAGSIGTNPVVVRRISKMLVDAGFMRVHAGVGGAELAKPLEEIRLLDVYKAVEPVESGIFAIHEHPSPACYVGCVIQPTLQENFNDIYQAMGQVLADRTMQDILTDIKQRHT